MSTATATKPKPAPSGATNTVKAGGSARTRAAAANVAANKEAVAKLNEQANAPTRSELVAQAQQLGVKGASGMNMSQLADAIAKNSTAASSEPEAKTTPTYRPKLAQEQLAALKAWEKSGRKGARPETPDYDAIQEQYANGGARAARARRKSNGGAGRTKRSARGLEAEAAKQRLGGAPPERYRIADDKLALLIYNVRTADPNAQWRDEMHHARWVQQLSVSQQRWLAAWEAFDPKVKPKAVSESKQAAAKPATSKPATKTASTKRK